MPIITGYLLCKLAETIRNMAEEEYYGVEKIKQELLELQMRQEMGEIAEEEYLFAESALTERLEEGHHRRE